MASTTRRFFADFSVFLIGKLFHIHFNRNKIGTVVTSLSLVVCEQVGNMMGKKTPYFLALFIFSFTVVRWKRSKRNRVNKALFTDNVWLENESIFGTCFSFSFVSASHLSSRNCSTKHSVPSRERGSISCFLSTGNGD